MAMACRSALSRFCFTLLLLNAAIAVQASPISSLVRDGSGSDCDKDCSKEEYSPVCSSNGETFDNMCDFEQKRCQADQNWAVIYKDRCVTLPPQAANLCKQHQKRIENMPIDEYNEKCDYNTLFIKRYITHTLTLADLTACYEPDCDGNKYVNIQCSYNFEDLCWCSDSEGIAIDGTLQENLTLGDCNHRNSCLYEERLWRDGDLFTSGCGLCECLDGVVTCFEDYIPNIEGELTKNQTEQLIEELVQLFFFQYNHKDHVLIDIRHIHQHPTYISLALRRTTVEWKFNYYDRNGNDDLTPGEQYLFRIDIDNFLKCTSFLDSLMEVIDQNGDGELVIQEWGDFFGVDLLPENSGSSSTYSAGLAKRSISDQPRLGRREKKKFYYTLI